jgi:uncharacterized protein
MSAVVETTPGARIDLATHEGAVFADIRRAPGLITILHVETAPALRGQGLAAVLMEGIIALARAEGAKVAPSCSYAASYFASHPEHQALRRQ